MFLLPFSGFHSTSKSQYWWQKLIDLTDKSFPRYIVDVAVCLYHTISCERHVSIMNVFLSCRVKIKKYVLSKKKKKDKEICSVQSHTHIYIYIHIYFYMESHIFIVMG